MNIYNWSIQEWQQELCKSNEWTPGLFATRYVIGDSDLVAQGKTNTLISGDKIGLIYVGFQEI